MSAKNIPESLLIVTLSGILILFFAACDTLGGNVGAGVYVGTESTMHVETSSRGGPPDHAPAHGYRKKHTYRYYHDEQVYYDISRGLYFYYEGSNWQVSASLPSRYRMDLGGYVTIELNTSQPHLRHEENKEKYPPGYKKEKEKNKSKGKWSGYGHDDGRDDDD